MVKEQHQILEVFISREDHLPVYTHTLSHIYVHISASQCLNQQCIAAIAKMCSTAIS